MADATFDPGQPLNLHFRQARAGSIILTFLDTSSNPYDISAITWQLNVKGSAGKSANVLQLTTSNGLSVGGSGNHQMTVALTETQSNIPAKIYYYELYDATNKKTWLFRDFDLYLGDHEPISSTETVIVDLSGTPVTVSIEIGSTNHFRGKYTTLVALQTAVPTGSQGDYATVEAGIGTDVVVYNWDSTNLAWVAGGSGGGSGDIDGGSAASVYLSSQSLDGGTA